MRPIQRKRRLILPSLASALLLTGLVAIVPSFALGQGEPETVTSHSAQPAASSDSPFRHVPDLQFHAPRSAEAEQWIRLKLKDERKLEPISTVAGEQSPLQDSSLTGTNASQPEPEAQRWSSFFPIWGEEARKRGYELPFPFGISSSFFYAQRDVRVDSIDVDVNHFSLDVEKFAAVDVRSTEWNWSMRFDTWVFPFLNLYLLGGYTRQHTAVKISVQKSDVDIDLDLDGYTIGGGATLVGGYKQYFAVLDTNYTFTDLEGDFKKRGYPFDQQVLALLVSARVGFRSTIGPTRLSSWIGGTYWGVAQTIDGTINVPNLGTVDFTVKESPESSFSMHIGTHVEVSQSFNLLFDMGSNFSDLFSVTPVIMYRF